MITQITRAQLVSIPMRFGVELNETPSIRLLAEPGVYSLNADNNRAWVVIVGKECKDRDYVGVAKRLVGEYKTHAQFSSGLVPHDLHLDEKGKLAYFELRRGSR